jgi:hypothetical protein
MHVTLGTRKLQLAKEERTGCQMAAILAALSADTALLLPTNHHPIKWYILYINA